MGCSASSVLLCSTGCTRPFSCCAQSCRPSASKAGPRLVRKRGLGVATAAGPPKDSCGSTYASHTLRPETRCHLRFERVVVCDGQHHSAKIFAPARIDLRSERIVTTRRLTNSVVLGLPWDGGHSVRLLARFAESSSRPDQASTGPPSWETGRSAPHPDLCAS
jgi:hypothetical protein